jgi:propanol-preferring alcohol dehydrogenase
MTRQDGRDFVALAAKIGIHPRTTVFRLDQVNDALAAVANDAIDGAAVVIP